MRVTHVVPAVFGSVGALGGAERYAYELARAMSRRTPTRLVSFGDSAGRWSDGDLHVRVLPRTHYIRGNRFNPISAALVGEILRSDVVHCHQKNILASSLSAMLARAAHRTIVVTDHGGGGFDFSWYMSTDALFHRHLHVSEFSRLSAGQSTEPSSSVLLAGVDTTTFAVPETRMRGSRVLFAGRLLAHKGVHDLIEALPAGLGLDIVGPESDPTYAHALRGLAEGRDVAFLGVVRDLELVAHYQRALCVVLPSTYRNRFGADTTVPELLGQTLLEGMSCGTPAIATDVGGMPETVVEGKTGFIIPPGDPSALRDRLELLAGSPSLVEDLGSRAAEHIRIGFTWDRVVERCFAGYAGR